MSLIYLVRHGIAEDWSGSGRDEDRALSREGADNLQRAAAALAWLEVEPGAIVSSPLRRARETAEILRGRLAPQLELTLDPQLRPGADIEAAVQGLPGSGAQVQIWVGHEPSISALASALLTGSPHAARLPFKPGSVLAIELASLSPAARGTLRWFSTPEQLGRLGA